MLVRRSEALEVVDESVDHTVRESVLLVEKDLSVDDKYHMTTGSSLLESSTAYPTLRKMLQDAEYWGICASFSITTAEWLTGTDTFERTLPMMVASRIVQSPDWQHSAPQSIRSTSGSVVGT
jgi:hypothetical protein